MSDWASVQASMKQQLPGDFQSGKGQEQNVSGLTEFLTVGRLNVRDGIDNNSVLIDSVAASTINMTTRFPQARKGAVYGVTNMGTGELTIIFDTAANATLPQFGSTAFMWTGTSWVPAMPVPGSNANGKWIKYPDGTMIQSNYIAGPFATVNAQGAVFFVAAPTITFPIPFVDITSVDYTAISSAYLVWCGGSTTTITTADFYIIGNTATSVASGFYWQAIGKWK